MPVVIVMILSVHFIFMLGPKMVKEQAEYEHNVSNLIKFRIWFNKMSLMKVLRGEFAVKVS